MVPHHGLFDFSYLRHIRISFGTKDENEFQHMIRPPSNARGRCTRYPGVRGLVCGWMIRPTHQLKGRSWGREGCADLSHRINRIPLSHAAERLSRGPCHRVNSRSSR
jgi:hypothetical protein